jgi:hypothetical protein
VLDKRQFYIEGQGVTPEIGITVPDAKTLFGKLKAKAKVLGRRFAKVTVLVIAEHDIASIKAAT